MPFEFIKTEIEDVILIEPKVFGDSRGFFLESYKKSDFENAGICDDFNQDNHSKSTKGVLRGLHYQLAPKTQAKIVRCPKGRIFDVAVDIRKNSKTFGKWVGYELSEENKRMLYIPSGFAHGFVVLSDEAELLYKASNEFCQELDRGIKWNDPKININWNLDFEPLVSEKDSQQPLLSALKDEDLL
ncbi:MAG: dTDP-4-dehydrorhamnose 3,5-epimerase [Candidatus Gastranaerophilales bacterium]|nr:dTDP-4-dehydrorhamnose 3,5-epimerase [Candidatus Gastranaerophilales bacterium]